PDEPKYITIGFEKGNAVSLDGERLSPRALVEKLNEIGGAYGVGIADIVEDRLVGMKSRGVYETPGGTILYYAHEELEYLCLDRDTQAFKRHVGIKMAELVYDGKWYTPLREAISAFVDSTQETVTGEVRLKLYKGSISSAGAKSPYSLYNETIASFGDSHELYSHKDSAGFINLFGLPLKVRALMKQQLENENK
ncbi:MAG: argininosuccinate synthase, partial [Clostridia bacterium]